MKIVQEGPAVFRLEMESADADEQAIERALCDIGHLLTSIKEHGYSQETRNADRAGYWRYAEVERAFDLIRNAAENALQHIKLLDFPEDAP